MKNVVRNLVVLGLFAAMSASAQTGAESGTQWGRGQDSINCARAFSLYRSDYQQGNHAAAIENWRIVWRDCPRSSVNLAAHGIAMYKGFMVRELDQTRKMALFDTLMMVYEKGMELRPQNRGNLLVNMAQDIEQFANTPENQPRLLKILEEIMELEKERTTARTYASYMNIIFAQNAALLMSDEDLLETYTKISDQLSDAIKKTTGNEELARARDMIDDIFINSNAAGCENLLKIYGEKYEENKDDPEFLRKLTRLLVRKDCTESQLFEQASEQQFALNPTPAAAYNMARLFFSRENFDRAIEFFAIAIETETDPVDKAMYNYQLGTILLSKYRRFADAKRHAVEAIRLRPDWGQPHILLANTYASGPACGERDFERKFINWVIVDKLQRARTVDPDVAPTVDPLIREFSRHFPNKEELFFENITEGSTVTVGCWVNESTRVRFN